MAIVFSETRLKGAFVVEPGIFKDNRGFFGLSFSQEEFEAHGINLKTVECNISFNDRRHTIRGLHFQCSPFGQAKLVRCTRGSIYDVIVDLRPDSPTFKQWLAEELTANNHRMLYVPEGFAHGFLTLEDNTEVFYQMSSHYVPASCRGIRWNDPALAIRWPTTQEITINLRDQNYLDFPHESKQP